MFNRERVYVFPGAEEITRQNRMRRIRRFTDSPISGELVIATLIAAVSYRYHIEN